MCNLYRLQSGNAVIAQMFGVDAPAPDNRADEIYPGYPGVVLAQGALRTMAWGFPVVLKGRQGQPLRPRPVTNARDDKLHTRFWRDSFVARRCLIPADAWAEPEGADRAMTRTWYAPAGEYPFAIAGLWRPTDIWGDTYAMVMVDAARRWSMSTIACRSCCGAQIGASGSTAPPKPHLGWCRPGKAGWMSTVRRNAGAVRRHRCLCSISESRPSARHARQRSASPAPCAPRSGSAAPARRPRRAGIRP